jgi:hypothetical protein
MSVWINSPNCFFSGIRILGRAPVLAVLDLLWLWLHSESLIPLCPLSLDSLPLPLNSPALPLNSPTLPLNSPPLPLNSPPLPLNPPSAIEFTTSAPEFTPFLLFRAICGHGHSSRGRRSYPGRPTDAQSVGPGVQPLEKQWPIVAQNGGIHRVKVYGAWHGHLQPLHGGCSV